MTTEAIDPIARRLLNAFASADGQWMTSIEARREGAVAAGWEVESQLVIANLLEVDSTQRPFRYRATIHGKQVAGQSD